MGVRALIRMLSNLVLRMRALPPALVITLAWYGERAPLLPSIWQSYRYGSSLVSTAPHTAWRHRRLENGFELPWQNGVLRGGNLQHYGATRFHPWWVMNRT